MNAKCDFIPIIGRGVCGRTSVQTVYFDELMRKSAELDQRELGCNDCSYVLASNVNFCPWCGKRLKKSEDK